MFNFPTARADPESRRRWICVINRADLNKPYKLKEPGISNRVCSEHFVDGRPTKEHPDPELKLGKGNQSKLAKPRQGHQIRASSSAAMDTDSTEHLDRPTDATETDSAKYTSILFAFVILFYYCVKLFTENQKLALENAKLKFKNKQLLMKLQMEQKSRKDSSKYTFENIVKDDSCAAFYTGIAKKSLVQKLHSLIERFVRRKWRGFNVGYSLIKRKFTRSPKKFGPTSKIASIDEFLLTLMKLRLGLLNRDLADRFKISETVCSRIIKTWLAAMRMTLVNLVYWPMKEQIIASKPARFRRLPDLRIIIDCSELFIETPKDPALQCMTWSEYKHHNTVKFLVGVAPNSAITYISKCYCGRASDKAVTLNSGLLDKLEMYDMIQADKGFNIASECESRLITLDIPPGKRGAAQLSVAAVNKTKRIANLRIIVEQVIRRLKTFRILQTELPISLLPCVDDIVTVCAALTNLKNPIYTT